MLPSIFRHGQAGNEQLFDLQSQMHDTYILYPAFTSINTYLHVY